MFVCVCSTDPKAFGLLGFRAEYCRWVSATGLLRLCEKHPDLYCLGLYSTNTSVHTLRRILQHQTVARGVDDVQVCYRHSHPTAVQLEFEREFPEVEFSPVEVYDPCVLP